ncbi:MAG: cobalt-precorrin-5B (C(1))-methyltransferase CbiD [Lachnospiraceae bacterium]|nr:cobalt-precorrin-5B (C(1))-methyltransferase CbiD [Lachnospiraceae bacterium]
MAFEHYVGNTGKNMRMGYTTGTCAAAASAAATEGFLTGHVPEKISVDTPKGIPVEVTPALVEVEEDFCRVGITKDAGDDVDATAGMLIIACIRRTDVDERFPIHGGKGIGRVTKPGLDQPVGEAAINHVPREMIRHEMERICEEQGFAGNLEVEIMAPEGEEIAKKTFNPKLGIEGGISIIGTTGIVEPMSQKAFADSVRLEIRQKAAEGYTDIILTPGNYGQAFLQEQGLNNDNTPVVVCSNFIGDALEEAEACGIKHILLVGHIGKLVKLAGGIFHTHSHVADARVEILTANAACCGASPEICKELMNAATTDACLDILDNAGLMESVMKRISCFADAFHNRFH